MSIFNEKEKAKLMPWMNPVDYFNEHGEFMYIFSDDKKYDIIDPTTVRNRETDQVYKLEGKNILNGVDSYTKFQMLTQIKFKNNHRDAQNFIEFRVLKKDIPYVRIGTDYYLITYDKNRYGVNVKSLTTWKYEIITRDYGKDFVKEIPIFTGFGIYPNNVEFKEFLNNRYNLYSEFPHKPIQNEVTQNDFSHIHRLMVHIFGEQLELGYRYLKVLYEHPCQILPILVLASEERQTGKTTFLNLIEMIFGNNYINIRPEDLTGHFNAIYATSNIIGIDETVIEKQTAVEKLKSIATQKVMTVNNKYVSQYTVPFYSKIIICTNRVKDFMRIDTEEIRFWVRKVGTISELITDLEDRMLTEIPYLLKYLIDLQPINFKLSRMVFTAEELQTVALDNIKEESRSGLHKELQILIEDYFLNSTNDDEFEATAIDIKREFFQFDKDKSSGYIFKVLQNELKLPYNGETKRYNHFKSGDSKTGKIFTFKRSHFVNGLSNIDDSSVTNSLDDVPF